MSVKVQQQLSAVRETSPRPPVEGEEFNNMAQIKMDALGRNDITDKCGQHSDRYVDGTLSLFPRALCILDHRGESYSAHFFGDGRQRHDDVQASTDFSPSCTEHGTPSYFKWAQDLHHLLMDIEGVNLFKKYLTQEKCETRTLDFWFACEGLKKADPTKTDYIQQVIKLIFKKFVKKTLKEINAETRQTIADKISSKTEVDQTIFDSAQKEVEEVIMKTTYPNFLKSDIYLQHIQLMQTSIAYDSPKTDGLSSLSEASSSANSRDGLDILPTLHEDSELQMELCSRRLSFSRETRQHNKILESSRFKPEAQAGHYLHSSSRSSNSCHVKYASFLPTSAQDSELQSLSSDAHTDDTMSLTDSSSVDCGPVFSSKNYHKKQQRAAKRNASINKDHLFHNFIPRTQRLPKECAMQLEPDQLAAILIEKLTQVKKEQEAQEKIAEYLGKVEGDDRTAPKQPDGNDHSSMVHLAGLPPQLLTAAMRDKSVTNYESDQSILDQHVSRVWSDSSHQTPSRSPGHHSPPLKPHSPHLERRRSAPVGGGNIHSLPRADLQGVNVPSYHNTLAVSQNVHRTCRNTQHIVPHHNTSNNRHKKERDTYSSDSGTVHDFTPENEPAPLPHQSVHIHKHVHHSVIGANVPPNISRSPAFTSDQYATLPTDNQGRRSKDATRKSGSKKAAVTTDSSSSCVDSGVSVACDPIPLSVSAHDRVYNWVLDNGKYSTSTHGPDSEKDSLTRHKKSSHSTTSPVLARSSHAKKPIIYNSSRSGTLEHGTTPWPMTPSTGVATSSHGYFHSSHPWVHVSCGVQPSQPLAQDPSMPILPPPDTTTQLVEARRRLQDEARGKPAKTKASSSGRERMSHADISKSRICNKIAEADENISSHKKSAKKSYPVTLQESSSKPGASEMTVIGYCFGSEPVPYLTKLPGKNITLRQFKSLLSKKGSYRYFFKKASDEFGTGVVFEEILEDNEVLPLWEGKIFANVDLVD